VRTESASTWEPKLVAILAIDLTWPEGSALEHSAYEPWTAVARWEQEIVEKVQGFGGMVLQHTPSLLLIAFGIPRTMEQQPQRAVHAALALRQCVVGDQARLGEGPAPTLRLGLHWGPLLVVAPADERTPPVRAIGETLAIPVRLLGQAAPGEVLASGAMVRLLDGWCTLEPRRDWDNPGNGAGIGASVIIAARSELSASVARAPHRRRPFVGRAQQVAALRELWRGAQGGRGQVVGLVGEPGVGKSRLLAEFLRGSFPSGAQLLETRATAYTQMAPYGPIVPLLRRCMGIADGDDGPRVREQVTQHLARLDLPPEPMLSPLRSVLQGPLDDPTWSNLDPSMRRQRTLEVIQQVLRRESQVQPLLVVCEDAHWLDHETKAVLDRLVEGITEVPLLLLVTARPEYRPPWGQQAGYTFLRLDPLSPTDTAVFLDHWLGPDAGLDTLKHHLNRSIRDWYTQLAVARVCSMGMFVTASVTAGSW
jgi:class 3 adenylate cyclase